MVERLEMVLSGRRRAAMLETPELTSPSSLWSGFFLGDQRVSTLEMPDHWIPNYMVGLQFVSVPTKRFFLADGRMHEDVILDQSCVIVGPREVRRFRLDIEGRVCMLAIDPVVMQEITADAPAYQRAELIGFHSHHDPVLRDLIIRLRADVVKGCPSGPIFGELLCTRLAEEIIRRYSLGRIYLDEYRGGLPRARLRVALEYIDEHLGVELKSGDIAAATGLSKYHFGKAFKQSTGMTLHRYVLSRRIRRAQELLRNTTLPLADVAAATGFANQSHLTALFSTRIGVSPRRYRDAARRISVSFRLVSFSEQAFQTKIDSLI